MRILDQVDTLSKENISALDPLFREMLLFGYCHFTSMLKAENASEDVIKTRLEKFKTSIGRFCYSEDDIDNDHEIEQSCAPTSPLLFPHYSNFEILQAFIR